MPAAYLEHRPSWMSDAVIEAVDDDSPRLPSPIKASAPVDRPNLAKVWGGELGVGEEG